MLVRQATADDLDHLVELRALMFDSMGRPTDDHSWRAAARTWFADRLETPSHRIVVVEHDDEVVASAVGAVRDAAPSPSSAASGDVLINNVCTYPHARGHGYATAAFDSVLAWARTTGVGRAELLATSAGTGLYERAGFTRTQFPAMRLTF